MAASKVVTPRMPLLPTTKDLLRLYRIKAKKALSQNFIMDPRILKKFVKTAGKLFIIESDSVVVH